MEKALDEGYMDMSSYEELSREDTTNGRVNILQELVPSGVAANFR